MHEREFKYLGEFGQKVSEQTDFNEWVRYFARDGIQIICPHAYNQSLTEEEKSTVRQVVSSGTQLVFENRQNTGLPLDDGYLKITAETSRVVEEFIVDPKTHNALAKGLAQGMAEAGLIDEDWEKYTT